MNEENKKLKKGQKTKEGSERISQAIKKYRTGRKWSQEVKDKIKASTVKYKVYQYDKNYNLIAEYESLKQASVETGIDIGNLCKCCNKKCGFATAGGYIWEYGKKKIRPNYIKEEGEEESEIDTLYTVMYELIEDAYADTSLVGFMYNDKQEKKYREYLKEQWRLLRDVNYNKGVEAIKEQIDSFIPPSDWRPNLKPKKRKGNSK